MHSMSADELDRALTAHALFFDILVSRHAIGSVSACRLAEWHGAEPASGLLAYVFAVPAAVTTLAQGSGRFVHQLHDSRWVVLKTTSES